MKHLYLFAFTAALSTLLNQATAQHLENWGFEECVYGTEFYAIAGACEPGERPAPGWQIEWTSTDPHQPCVSDPLDGTFTVSRHGNDGTNYALRMVDTWDDQPLWVVSDPIPCHADQIFTATGSVYIEPGQPGEEKWAEIGLQYYKGPEFNPYSQMHVLDGTAETGRWVELTVEVTAPFWATHVRFVLSSGSAAQQVVHFEPKSLTRLVPNGRFSLGTAGQVPEHWTSLQVETAVTNQDGRLLVSKRQPQTILDFGLEFGCALSHGRLECWGINTFGQLGTGFPQYGIPKPSLIENLPGPIVHITTGYEFICAITESGELWCWGNNGSWQLGIGGPWEEDIWEPVLVQGFNGQVINATAGHHHACAVDETGAVWCWGRNVNGQVGKHGEEIWRTPQLVAGLDSGVVDIEAGGDHTCALLEGGRLVCWGRDNKGQLGDGGANEDKFSPTQVWGLEQGVKDFTVGYRHTCAVLESGAAKCWGNDEHGQLGDGPSLSYKVLPVSVRGLQTGVVEISAFLYHTCALLEDSSVKCWGSNHQGQLGISTSKQNYPEVLWVDSVRNAVAVRCGGFHTCAIRDSGELLCWGYDRNGQLGDGYPKAEQPFPVYVKEMGLVSGADSQPVAVVPNKQYRASAKGVILGTDAQSGALMTVLFEDSANKIVGGSDSVQVTATSPSDPAVDISLDVQPPADATQAVVRLHYPHGQGIEGWQTTFDDIRFGEVQREQAMFTDFFSCGSEFNDACGDSVNGQLWGSDGCAGYMACDTQCVDPLICYSGRCTYQLE